MNSRLLCNFFTAPTGTFLITLPLPSTCYTLAPLVNGAYERLLTICTPIVPRLFGIVIGSLPGSDKAYKELPKDDTMVYRFVVHLGVWRDRIGTKNLVSFFVFF
jgi:hypothetical protein